MRKGLSLVTLLLSTLALAPVAMANSVSFTLAQPSQTAAAGSTVSFIGTISAPLANVGDIYLNGDSANSTGGLAIDDSAFFANAPLLLTPGETFTDSLFTVAVGGAGTGTFTLLGGADGNASDILGTQNFTVDVAATVTPEPSSLLLFATGAAALCALSLRRRIA